MSVRRSILWTITGQLSYFVIQFAGSVVIARLLSPMEMGVYAVGMATLALIGSVQALGLLSLIVREQEVGEETLRTAFTINALINLVVALAAAAASFAAGPFFRQPEVTPVLLVLAVTPVIGLFEFRPRAMMQRQLQFGRIAAIGVLQNLANTATAVALAFMGRSSMSLAWGAVAGAVVSMAATIILGREHMSLRLSLTRWRYLLRFGAQMLAIAGLSTVTARLADLICGRLLGLAALGVYSRSANLTNMIWTNIYQAAGKVTFAGFAEELRSTQSLKLVYMKTLSIMTGLLWPLFAGLAILSGPAIHWLYGAKWAGAAVPLAWLCVAAIPSVAVTMVWEVFVLRRETARQVRLELVKTTLGLALFTAGCLFGLTWAAAARAVEGICGFGLYRPHLARMTQAHDEDVAPILGRSAVLTGLACAPAVLVMTFYGWSASAPIAAVAASIAAGGAAWLAGLRAFRHPLFEELMHLRARLSR